MPKVLVIDDSVSVRKVVERALSGRQVDVVCAASGIEALECMERDAPDVIVCDVVMPDRDGYEICEFVKNHPRLGDIPVLLMSGIVNDEVRQRAARARSEGPRAGAAYRRNADADAGLDADPAGRRYGEGDAGDCVAGAGRRTGDGGRHADRARAADDPRASCRRTALRTAASADGRRRGDPRAIRGDGWRAVGPAVGS